MTQIPLPSPTVIPKFNPKGPNEVFDPSADPVIPENSPSYVPVKIPRKLQVWNLVGVVAPALAVVGAMVATWGFGFGWLYLGMFLVMYAITGLGITIGYHRLFTHKSFSTSRAMTWFWAVAGSMAGEGQLLEWCAWHRKHHSHSDGEDDPHSPHHHPDDGELPATFGGFMKGFYHAHMGWFIRNAEAEPDYKRYVPDLMKDPLLVAVANQWRFWVWVGLLAPGIIAGVVTQSWQGALLGFLWGGAVRLFWVHHVTWSVNSVCHIWGAKEFVSHDESRNNPVMGILALGEGWHNTHHAFPTSARHGLRWWQFDLSYVVIKTMSLVGLTWDIKVPSKDRQAAKSTKKAA